MTLCLPPDDLVALTGYRRTAEQIRFLDAAGVPYRLNKCGKPVVARANAERYLGVSGGGAMQPEAAAREPNWNVLDLLGARKAA